MNNNVKAVSHRARESENTFPLSLTYGFGRLQLPQWQQRFWWGARYISI